MTKYSYILIVSLFSLLNYGQQTTFEPNINPDAQVLKQFLSKNGDSLILESKKIIRQVDIIEDNFFKTIIVGSTKTKIDLNKLPYGKFIIKARLGRKRIVMYLVKHEASNFLAANTTLETNKKPKTVYLTKKEQNSKRNLTAEQLNSIDHNGSDLYWVVHHSNSSFGSHKSMSLEYRDKVSHLISKNKLEMKSDIAKNNKLLIYEVYDRSQFMTKQLRNQHYYKSKNSKVFNVIPIYSSANPNGMTP